MLLREILDPSTYRSSDERNPQSPYYAGQEVNPQTEEYPTQFEWHFYNSSGDEITAAVSGSVTIVTEYHDHIPARRYRADDNDDLQPSETSIERLAIEQITVDGTTMTGKRAAQRFGTQGFENYKDELVEAAVKGIVAEYDKPSITNWKRDTELVFV